MNYEALSITKPLFDDSFVKTGKRLLRANDFYIDSDDSNEDLIEIFEIITSNTNKEKELLEIINKAFKNNELLGKYIFCAAALSYAEALAKNNPELSGILLSSLSRFGFICGEAENKENKENKEKQEEQMPSNTISLEGGRFLLFGDIHKELEIAKNNNHELTLLNLYKGVNISSKAKIIENNEKGVLLSVTPVQLFAIKDEGLAYIIKDEQITCDLQAKISNFNIANSQIKLADLERSTKTTALLRKYPRVHPDKLTAVELCSKDESEYLDGRLYDISQGGMGVVSSIKASWKSGDILKAFFILNIDGKPKSIELEVELVVALSYQGSMRYCCKITDFAQPDMPDIIKYSSTRVEQTLQEIEQNAAALKNTLI